MTCILYIPYKDLFRINNIIKLFWTFGDKSRLFVLLCAYICLSYMCVYIHIYICIRVYRCICMHEGCPEGIQPCNMENRDIFWRRYKIQETLYTGQWFLRPLQSRHMWPHTVLPIAISCSVVFSWISSMVWNFFPFKGDFSFGKRQKFQGSKSGL